MTRIAYLTSIDFGPGTLASLGDAIGELGVQRPLLVADQGVLAAGLVAKALANLQRATSTTLRNNNVTVDSSVKP